MHICLFQALKVVLELILYGLQSYYCIILDVNIVCFFQGFFKGKKTHIRLDQNDVIQAERVMVQYLQDRENIEVMFIQLLYSLQHL